MNGYQEFNLFEQVRLADLLDIGIVSLLLYVTFVWLRDRASRSLGLIAVWLVSLFLLARWLELYLTTMVFQYGTVGILLALVVVFQHDIRHGFERLTSSWWFRRSPSATPSQLVADTITEAVAVMARERIGALIVLPGRQPLDRHLRGGEIVDARVSRSLLLSIFHPKSPGHDGAVLIEESRIAQLGLHLPMTANVAKVRDGGTRHTAALGLAECCDATVLVVSEERGTITIAHDGELTLVTATDLAQHLRRYFSNRATTKASPATSRTAELATLLAAVGCAVVLWFLFAYQADTIQRTFVIPIEYRNLPEQFEIEEPKVTFAEVTLSGSEPAFALLDPTKVAVSLDVDDSQGGNVMRWQTRPNLKNLPTELSIESISPEIVSALIREKVGQSGEMQPKN